MTAALLGVPLVVLGAGWAAPAAFLLAAAMLAVFAVGVAVALWLRARDAVRYGAIGRVAADEA